MLTNRQESTKMPRIQVHWKKAHLRLHIEKLHTITAVQLGQTQTSSFLLVHHFFGKIF